MILKILALSLALAPIACKKDNDKDSDKGDALGAPAVQPPVLNNLPKSMQLWSANLTGDGEVNPRDGARNTILSYLSTKGGNVSPTARLGFIDGRIAELDSRIQTSPPRICLKTAAAAFTLSGQLPGGGSLPLMIQCRDDLDGGTAQQLAFGLNDTGFYLYERTSTSKISVIATAPLDGSAVEVWQISGPATENGGATFVHVVGSNAANGIELAYAGEVVPNSQAMVCGVQVRTKGDLVYAKGSFYAGTACSEEMTFCLGADGEELDDVSQCTAAGISTFTLTAITPSSTGITAANAALFTDTEITGVADFSEGEAEGKP